MPGLTAAKVVVSIIASAGVGKIASEIIKNNTTNVGWIGKAFVGIGSLAIGSMATEATTNHIDRLVKTVIESRKKTEDEEGTTEEE
jgi:uncharacterized membrane protein YeaQ/YmgE (transglycosylase-associated protein family)